MKPFLCLFLTLIALESSAQSSVITAKTALPRGWEKLQLGMNLKDVKKTLEGVGAFDYQGDPEVSMLNNPVTSLLSVKGNGYFKEGLFQFYQDKLYLITLVFNERELDYNLLFSQLSKKYGLPGSMDPKIARWEDGAVQFILEKPLALKYIDLQIFQSLLKTASDTRSLQSISREKFLETF